MKVTLLGYSSFISKKSGNQALVIGYGYEDQRWKGLHIEQKYVNPDVVSGVLKPGCTLNIDFNSGGFVQSVEALD